MLWFVTFYNKLKDCSPEVAGESYFVINYSHKSALGLKDAVLACIRTVPQRTRQKRDTSFASIMFMPHLRGLGIKMTSVAV